MALFALSGFLAGFLGPMVLSPDSNIGPIIGILFSGPAGVVLGVIACLLARLAPAVFTKNALRGLAAVLAVVTLYYCFPKPRAVESVLDAEISDCVPAAQLYPQALQSWEAALAQTPQAHPLPDWQAQAQRNVEDFNALAVTLHVERRRIIFERRKPWDRGERFAGPWLAWPETPHTYSVPASSGSCEHWRSQQRALYWPMRDETDPPVRPTQVWPPVDAPGFLRLQAIGAVPPRIQTLLK